MTTEGTHSVSKCSKDNGLCRKATFHFRAILFTLFCTFFTLQIDAQIGDPIFRNLNAEFPEIDKIVRSIERDSRGYVWFGGFYNLQRFDGISVREYRIRHITGGYTSGGTSIIFEDSDKNLWVFCNGFILLYDPFYDDFHYLKLQLPEPIKGKGYPESPEYQVPNFVQVSEDKEKRLWIGFGGDQQSLLIRVPISTLMAKIKEKKNASETPIITLDEYDPFPIELRESNYHRFYVFNIVNILVDGSGDVWVNREGWLERYTENPGTQKGRFIRYLETKDNNGTIVGVWGRFITVDNQRESVNTRIFLDKNESLWASTANHLFQFLDTKPDQRVSKDSIINFPLFQQSLYPDSDKADTYPEKWINCYPLGDNNNYSGELSFFNKNILWLFQRNGKAIDVYSFENGNDNLIHLRKIKQFNRDLSDRDSWQWSLLHVNHLDEEGIFWAADRTIFDFNSAGVVTLDTRNMFMFGKIDRKPNDPTSILKNEIRFYRDYKRNIWLLGQDIYHSSPDLTNIQKIIPNTEAWSAVEDNNHNMWLYGNDHIRVVNLPAYYSGKDRSVYFINFEDQNFDIQFNPDKGDYLEVHDLLIDKSQTLWIYVIIINDSFQIPNRPSGALYYYKLDVPIKNYKDVKFKKFEISQRDSIYFGTGRKTDFWGFQPSLIQGERNIYLLSSTALIRIDSKSHNYEIFYTGNQDQHHPFARISGGTKLIDESIPDTIKIYGVEWFDGFMMKDNYLKVLTFSDQPGNQKLEYIQKYDDKRFPSFPSQPLLDKNKNIWFMSDTGGLLYYDPQEDKILEYNNDYTLEGMLGPGPHKDREGFMYFLTLAAVQVFHPDSVVQNPYIPKINISDIYVNGNSILAEKDTLKIERIQREQTLNLPYNQNNLSLSFNATGLTNPKQNLYKYKLHDWDDQWIETNALNRTATYSNLSPGTYTFLVMGSNNDGIWNDKATSIEITIQPPWRLTWWAYGIYFLFFGGVLFGTIRFFIVRRSLKNKVRLEQIQLSRMKDVDTLKSRFFANVSHEFRTPLTLILGPLKQMLESETDPDKKGKLSMIARSSRKLLFLVNQLLDFAKLKTGRLTLQAEETDLVAFVKRRFASFESLAVSRGINFQFESDTEKLMVYIDKEKLEKVIVNLLSNAFKFTTHGKGIFVKVRNCMSKDQIAPGQGAAEILIKDQGIGMAPGELKKIFDRYYQVSNSNSGNGGSGLGLTLVKEMIDLHHGEVKVKSKKGKGTTFKVHIPLGKDHLNASELIQRDDSIPELIYDKTYSRPIIDKSLKEELWEIDGKAHLLVVDDNSDMRNYLKEILQDDFIIEEAINGQEGITRAIEHSPDLVISDLMMPEMDGTELCQKLKSDERISHIPVIMLTARAGTSDRLKGFEIGADDYITKPFSPNELRIRIQNLIEQRKSLRERFRKDITLQPRDITITSTDEKFLNKAMKVLEKFSVNDEFGTDQFAKEIGLSRSQMHRKLKALTDQSCSEFIRSYRLNHARKLLEADFGNVADVSYEVGFSSPSYFTECFKSQFGVLPSDYTNHNIEN